MGRDSMSRYVKQDGALHEITGRCAKVDGVWHTVTARYAKQNGVWSQVWSSGKKLSDLPVGSLLKINENGVPTQYIVVNQGNPDTAIYDVSCNGTWILRKMLVYDFVTFQEPNTPGNFATSNLKSYLNSTIYDKFDSSVKSNILTAKIPFIVNSTGAQTTPYGIDVNIFALTAYEVGLTPIGYTSGASGALLSYFESGTSSEANAKRVAYYNVSTAHEWWTRDGYSERQYQISQDGSQCYSGNYMPSTNMPRPAMILNPNALASSSVDADGCYTLQ